MEYEDDKEQNKKIEKYEGISIIISSKFIPKKQIHRINHSHLKKIPITHIQEIF